MATNDQILDFHVSMELSHQDASVGWGVGMVGGKTGKAAYKQPKMIGFWIFMCLWNCLIKMLQLGRSWVWGETWGGGVKK